MLFGQSVRLLLYVFRCIYCRLGNTLSFLDVHTLQLLGTRGGGAGVRTGSDNKKIEEFEPSTLGLFKKHGRTPSPLPPLYRGLMLFEKIIK